MKPQLVVNVRPSALATAVRKRALLSLLPLFPLGYLLVLILWFSVDVPFWDEWDLVPLVEQVYQGRWPVWEIWNPHNEHRLVFPEIALLTLAWLSRWNKLYELLLNVGVAGGTFLVLVHHTKRTLCSAADLTAWWVSGVISLFVFSLNQFENWFMGMQLCVFLTVFSVVTGYSLLTQALARWSYFVGAIGFGVLATFSFANGILYWPIALLMLFLLPDADHKRKGLKVVLWSLLGLTVSRLYLYDANVVHSPRTIETVYVQVLSSARYVFSYLGSPLTIFAVRTSFGADCSGIVGAAGTAAFGLLLWSLIRRYHLALSSLAYPAALGGYAIGSAFLTSLGRAGLGLSQALSSRYIIFSSLLWIANTILLAVLVNARAKADGGKEGRLRTHEYLAAMGVVLLLSLSSAGGTVAAVQRAEKRLVARDELLRPRDPERLQPLYPDSTLVLKRVEILKRYRLSLFREARPRE